MAAAGDVSASVTVRYFHDDKLERDVWSAAVMGRPDSARVFDGQRCAVVTR